MKNIMIVVGTRPGAIKLIPIYFALKNKGIPTFLCATFQHDELLQQVFDIFGVTPDASLKIMRQGQDLFYLTQAILEKISEVYRTVNPELVMVLGDTVTAYASALAAFYLKKPIAHIEAGLRTGNKHAPFPEEVFRQGISTMADYHFAPTSLNVANLLAEGISRTSIFCTGNSIVDALQWIQEKITSGSVAIDKTIQSKVLSCKKNNQKIVLLTAHRRESFDGGILRICNAVKTFALEHPDVVFIYPAHPNPSVQSAIENSGIKHISNIFVTTPLIYKDLIYLILMSDFVMTDSGGIQEEAISIGKKVLVLREVTERVEGIWEGLGVLVGTDQQKILSEMDLLYNSTTATMQPKNVYGDGNTGNRIATIVHSLLQDTFISANKTLLNKKIECSF
ncbi:MAG: UDP-N-acetylglucosamine 2-epimerase (non-hydrolyzing) [bacterium]